MSYHSLDLTPENFERSRVPQLDSDKMEMLWHDSWYDGPLTGVIDYEGRKHYFDLYEPDDNYYGYQYVTIELTDEEFQQLKFDHERWEKAVAEYNRRFTGRAWDEPECKKYWDDLGFEAFDESAAFYRPERVTGWFCERGTAKQQFAAIKVLGRSSPCRPSL